MSNPNTGQDAAQAPTTHEAPTPQRPQDERPATAEAAVSAERRARQRATDEREAADAAAAEAATDKASSRSPRWGVSHPWRAVQIADGTVVDHHGARLDDTQVDEARDAAERHGMTLEQR